MALPAGLLDDAAVLISSTVASRLVGLETTLRYTQAAIDDPDLDTLNPEECAEWLHAEAAAHSMLRRFVDEHLAPAAVP